MTYVYINLEYLGGADMINKLLIQKDGNEAAIESLIQTCARLELPKGKKFTQNYFANYKKRLDFTEIPADKAKEFYQNPLFKASFSGGATDTFRFLLLEGKLKTITPDNITNPDMLGDELKYAEWKNVCDHLTTLLDL